MTDSKLSTSARVALAFGLAAVLLGAAVTGGMGLWARGSNGGGLTGAALESHEQRGGVGVPGQRTGQATPRPPEIEDLLPPRWRWWRDAEVQKTVGLTTDQVERFEALFNDRGEEMAPFIREYRRQLDELRRMAAERKVSAEEFAIHAASFEALKAKLDESRTIMLYRMSRELNDQQYKKLQEVSANRRSRGGGRGSPPNR